MVHGGAATPAVQRGNDRKKRSLWDTIKKQRALILMSIPFVVWVIIFAYVPLWSWTMAFQNYKPGVAFMQQEWVGFTHFINLFKDATFLNALRNTLVMSGLGIVLGFFAPIIFALLLNEVKVRWFKKITQTISYLPHFVSWVITASIVTTILSNEGIINTILQGVGLTKGPIAFMTAPTGFWFIVAFADIWKEMGWNAIIYLAAISGIDPSLYEAASVDGAGRWRKMFHITLPSIMPTITVLLILSIGGILNIGFERQKLLGNSLVKSHSLVIDQYALEYGIGMFRYSYGTAIGIFKSVVSLALIFIVNAISGSKQGTTVF